MQRGLLIPILFFTLPMTAKAADTSEPKYKCHIEIQDKDSIRNLDIPFNLKTKTGTLSFEDKRAQRAEYTFFGDALRMELFVKSNSAKSEWQSIAQSLASGNVRAAMLKGPPGVLISCKSGGH
jgi:hypothetical protein